MKALNRQTADSKQYTEKIIQFGEGNFLRAFADWAVNKMNKATDFNASVVVVQPRDKNAIDVLNSQDGLYHVNLQGLKDSKPSDTIELIDCVSRGMNPYREFDEFMKLAENPDMRFVFSNTTEAGIVFDSNCQLTDKPAASYPGKLTQLLYRRFEFFKADASKGLIILPCELIFHNGNELKKCILQYIDLWSLGEDFKNWFQNSCPVYNTLVDRIVPGYPKDNADEIKQKIGYDDKLLVKGEIFHLWVIEAPKSLADEFPADKAGLNVLFVDSEAPYHERKVTLLNGPHTLLSPVGYLSGLDTVRECVEDELVGRYVKKVMFDELMQTLNLPKDELEKFAGDILDRFRNPYVKHFVTSIMLNSFPKFKTRDLPGLNVYLERNGKLPKGIVLGLAGIVTYYKGGFRGETKIELSDDPRIIALLSDLWQSANAQKIALGVLSAEFIWGEDLSKIPGLQEMLAGFIQLIQEKGMRQAVESIL